MNQSVFPDRPLPPNTGRVQTTNNDNYDAFKLYREYTNIGTNNFSTEAVTNIHMKNELSNIFFSDLNINAIQDAIRYYVWKKSCHKFVIDKQNENEIKIVMRAVYLEYAQHKPTGILQQIKDLNMRVIDYCTSRILQEIGMYIYYKKDINQIPDPLSRGEFSSAKGGKQNTFNGFF